MVLAVVRQWQREGRAPPRDIVLAFLADEEAGSDYGAHFLVDNHPELFDGCTEAIGEVGGFSYTVSDDLRLYLIETAEKGIDWLRLHARGRPGHGSMIHDDNAVTALREAVARVGRHRFPVVMTPTVRAFLERGRRACSASSSTRTTRRRRSPSSARSPTIIGATIRNTANPTRLEAGYKDNVIPGRASATIDCRTLPGPARAVPGAAARRWSARTSRSSTIQRQPALETTFDGAAGRRDGGGAAGRGPGRPAGAVHALRRHRRQGVRHARHPLLRVLAAAAAAPT